LNTSDLVPVYYRCGGVVNDNSVLNWILVSCVWLSLTCGKWRLLY